jgi:hypothetical protein
MGCGPPLNPSHGGEVSEVDELSYGSGFTILTTRSFPSEESGLGLEDGGDKLAIDN